VRALDHIPLFGLGTQGKSLPATAQLRVNLYYERLQEADRTAMVAYKTPGLASPFVDFGDTAIRGVIAPPSSDFVFYVHRGTFWQVDNAGTATNRGTLNTTSGKVSMAENGTQIVIVDGTNGYVYNMSTLAFAQIVNPNFPNGAVTVTWIDGYFLVDSPTSGQFYISDYHDGTSWPGDFATAESNPDGIVRITADHQDLILLGSQSTEFWSNTGAADFPFERTPGTTQEWGLAARSSIAKFDDSICGLFQNRLGQVIAAVIRGYRVQRISNHDLEAKWAAYGAFSDAVAYSYMLDGHPMYVVSFPTGSESWLYDGSTNSWSQLKSNGLTRHRSELGVNYLGKNYVTDYSTGRVYRLSSSVYTDNGEPIRWEIIGRHVFDGFRKLGVDAFQLDMETGVGLETGQGTDPQVMLRVSRDGGRTWGNERWRSCGKVGEYKKRVLWGKCGRGRDFTFWLAGTDPVKTAILGAGHTCRGKGRPDGVQKSADQGPVLRHGGRGAIGQSEPARRFSHREVPAHDAGVGEWVANMARGVGSVVEVLTVTASLDFPLIAANGGTQDLTVTVTGVKTIDPEPVVNLGIAYTLNAGLVFPRLRSAPTTR
jgi:hypothetical protein